MSASRASRRFAPSSGSFRHPSVRKSPTASHRFVSPPVGQEKSDGEPPIGAERARRRQGERETAGVPAGGSDGSRSASSRGWRTWFLVPTLGAHPRTWAALGLAVAMSFAGLFAASAVAQPRSSTRPRTARMWVPPREVEWQWELDHSLCNASGDQTPTQTAKLIASTVADLARYTSCSADLGITSGSSPVMAVDGAVSPATNPKVYDIDGFDNTGTDNGDEAQSLGSSDSPVVAELHSLGDHVICYVDVGTAENWRPDYSEFKGSTLNAVQGWPGEFWISLAPDHLGEVEKIMTKRFEMCRDNHFDAVEPDNMDSSENGTANSQAEQLRYDEWVADEVHRLGMSVAQKNFEDESATLSRYFDFVIEEQCYQYADCLDLAPYYRAERTVLEVEYQGDGTSRSWFVKACTAGVNGQHGADKLGLDSVYLSTNLDGSLRVPCR